MRDADRVRRRNEYAPLLLRVILLQPGAHSSQDHGLDQQALRRGVSPKLELSRKRGTDVLTGHPLDSEDVTEASFTELVDDFVRAVLEREPRLGVNNPSH